MISVSESDDKSSSYVPIIAIRDVDGQPETIARSECYAHIGNEAQRWSLISESRCCGC